MAQQAGLSDLEFADKIPLRGGSVWRFKASGPATLDNYVANDNDDTITLTRQDSRRPSHAAGAALPKEHRSRFPVVSAESKPAQSHQASRPVAASGPQEGSGNASHRLDLRKTNSNGEGDSLKKKARTEPHHLIPELKLTDVSADGNCLFHSVSKALEHHGKDVHHLACRNL